MYLVNAQIRNNILYCPAHPQLHLMNHLQYPKPIQLYIYRVILTVVNVYKRTINYNIKINLIFDHIVQYLMFIVRSNNKNSIIGLNKSTFVLIHYFMIYCSCCTGNNQRVSIFTENSKFVKRFNLTERTTYTYYLL